MRNIRRATLPIGAAFALLLTIVALQPALACADGVSCAVVRQTPDGYVALRAGPKATARVLRRLKPYQIVVIDVSTCAPNREVDPWTHVTCIPTERADCRAKENFVEGWVNTRLLAWGPCPRDMNSDP